LKEEKSYSPLFFLSVLPFICTVERVFEENFQIAIKKLHSLGIDKMELLKHSYGL
jgi:hypothetical protein